MAEKRTNGKAPASEAGEARTAAPTPRLKTRYLEEIRPTLVSEQNYSNVMEAPRL